MKNRSIMIAATAIFISLSFVDKVFAGAWTVPKHKVWGEYYMKWDYAKREFTHEGKLKPLTANARTWEFVQEPKLEFGVTDWLTALTYMEYKESHYKQDSKDRPWAGLTDFARKNHGITSIKVGGRLRFIDKPLVVSTQTKVFIYPGYGNYHGDDPAFTNQPSIGRGDDAVEQRILIGKSFDLPLPLPWNAEPKVPCYLGAETGYRWRTRHVCNDIPYFVEGGLHPVQWLLLKGEVDGYQCHPGTGSIKESYGIVRVGGVWKVFGGDSIKREGGKLFNIEFQYGMTLWGKNTTVFQEWILKVDTQF
ncbi:MAG: hypothetical protein WC515_08100 [Candidatus Omnitrophota bacterium]